MHCHLEVQAIVEPVTVSQRPPVAMFTAPNAGPKTLSGTHTFVVGHKHAFVIDPGPEISDYQHGIVDWLKVVEIRPSAILLSHSHPDHAPGAVVLKKALDIPVWASEYFAQEAVSGLDIDQRFESGSRFPIDGDELQVLASPGHAEDHVSFWIPGARIFFSGDNILGQGSTLVAPPEGNMVAYMESLEVARRLNPAIIVPGHGPIIGTPLAKIDEYVAHRRAREEQLLAVLRDGSGTVQDLVARMYTDTDPRLHELAGYSVKAQLEKLKTEGKIVEESDRIRLRNG
jgi:glyoxylase-like metal-dependent hydrolase (beta-lactamase superfamily II)